MKIKYSDTYTKLYKKFDSRFMVKTYKYQFDGDYKELMKIRDYLSGYSSKIYQLNYDKHDYDLFYWDNKGCFDKIEDTNCFTIEFNYHKTEMQKDDFNGYKVFENLIANFESNIECKCYTQYHCIDDRLYPLSNKICSELLDKKIEYKGIKGKIIDTGREITCNGVENYRVYLFQKNRQRTHAYDIKAIDMCLGEYKEVLA